MKTVKEKKLFTPSARQEGYIFIYHSEEQWNWQRGKGNASESCGEKDG